MHFFRSKLYSEDRCLQYLFDLRYRNAVCPFCKRKNSYHRDSKKQSFTCNCGQSHIFPRKGTIFGSSHLPLLTWIHAILLISRSETRITAQDLALYLNVSYPTAWRMKSMIVDLLERRGDPEKRLTFKSIMQTCATTKFE